MSAFGWPKGAPHFTYVDLPMAGAVRLQPHPVIMPHELLGALQKENPKLWEEAIIGADQQCSDFWSEAAHDPDVKNHPGLQSKHDRSKTIPLGFHGDGAAFSKHDSLLTIAWNSLLGSGQTLKKRFVFTTLRP